MDKNWKKILDEDLRGFYQYELERRERIKSFIKEQVQTKKEEN